MSMFGGFGTALKGIAKAGANMAENSKVYKGINNARQSTMNPFYKAKSQPGSKNEGDASQSSDGSQSA